MTRKLFGAALGFAVVALMSAAAIASTPTTNYSWPKPTVGADANAWGTDLNSSLDGIDSVVHGVSVVANGACPTTGCTYSGPITVTDPLTLTGAGSTTRRVLIQTAGSTRWQIYGSADTESGSNSGTLFEIARFSDAGALIDSPLSINRASGLVSLADGLSVAGGIAGALTGNVTGNVTGTVTGNASTASKWASAVTLTLGGDASGSASIDGSAGVTLSATVATATTSTAGKVALATSTQAAAGSDSTHALTAASMSANCSATITAGYCVHPGGYVHQWGHYDTGSSSGWNGSPTSISYPYTPAHGCYAVQAITDNQGQYGSPVYALQVISAPSASSMTVQTAGYASGSHASIQGFYWSADCF